MRTQRLTLARLPWQSLITQHWPVLAGAVAGTALAVALSQALTFQAKPRDDSMALKFKWAAATGAKKDGVAVAPGALDPAVEPEQQTAPTEAEAPKKAPEKAPPKTPPKEQPATPPKTAPTAAPAEKPKAPELQAPPTPAGPAPEGAVATTPLRQDQWAGERPQLSPMPGARPSEQAPLNGEPSTPLSSGEAPPMPGADIVPGTFKLLGVEKPGGDVLVLGVLVNDQGYTEQVVIVVPSKYTLGDIGLMLGHQRKFWPDLIPPLLPGEKRWLELRFDHKGIDPNATGVLP